MQLTSQTLFGTYTALATPFNSDGSAVDLGSFKRLIDYQIESKVNGLVVSGSTGEAATLSDEEYRNLLEVAIEHVAGRVPVVAGVSANSTKKGVAIAQVAEDVGAAAILLVLPYYNKPSQDGIFAHFKTVREGIALPIIAYNVPGRTVSNLLPETLQKLAEEKIIIGVKEASGSIEQTLQYLRLVGDKISVFAGEDYIVYSCLTAGGKGVISASANVVPKMFVEVTDGCRNGDFKNACAAQLRLLPIVQAMFSETNPVPIKEALAQKGIIASAAVRLPLLAAQEQTKARIRSLLYN